MPAKFCHDPFADLLSAFNERSSVAVNVVWVTDLHAEDGAWGRTHFDMRPIVIEVDADCPVRGALDVLAHELAHVTAGFDAGHGEKWECEKAALLAACAAQGMDAEESAILSMTDDQRARESTLDGAHSVLSQLISWHCIASGPGIRFALGIEKGGEVSDIVAEIWRDTSTGSWLWKAGHLSGHEPTREYAARAAEAATLK